MSGHPPPNYPPPPPPPPQGGPGPWRPPKPTSGKAIGALVCGLVSLFVCPITALPGIVLGLVGIVETGRESERAGRGMAIAGTVTSGLAIVGWIVLIGVIVAFGRHQREQFDEQRQQRLRADSEIILDRLQEYARANGNSLGPGGPVLADPEMPEERQGEYYEEYDEKPEEKPTTVEGSLEIHHLVAPHELGYRRRRGRGMDWHLTVTGTSQATIRVRGWRGEILMEIEVQDAANRRFVRTRP